MKAQIFSGVIDTFESAKSNFLTFSQDGEGGLSPDFAANFTNSVDASGGAFTRAIACF